MRARRLTEELADALADTDGIAAPAGEWLAIVQPARSGHSTFFCNVEYYHSKRWVDRADAAEDHPELSAAVTELVDAFTAETLGYRAGGNALPDDEADAYTDRASEALHAVEALPVAEVSGHPDYVAALALIHRRWLVMEGSYSDHNARTECLLVDAVLTGHRFDQVPLLWHVTGKSRSDRPSDAELQAGWSKVAS